MDKSKKLTAKIILKTLEQNKKQLHIIGVKKIGLFGSYAKEKATQKSDLDFLVVFDKPSFDHYMDLKFLLESMFSKKVDLVMEKSLKPALDYVKEEARYAKV